MNAFLDKPNQETSQILFRFYYQGKGYKYFPGVSIKVTDWNPKTHRAHKSKEFFWEFNEKLDKIEKTIFGVIETFKIENRDAPSPKEMKFIIDGELNRTKEVKLNDDNVRTFFESWIARKRKLHNEAFERRWRTTVDNALHINPFLDFKDIGPDFFRQYVHYLVDIENINNTIQSKVNRMQQLCREALKYGIKVNPHFEDFKYKGEKVPPIYLYWEEVEALEQIDDYYVDCFVFRCYTGLRHSDLKGIKQSMLYMDRGKTMLRFDIVKQRKNHAIFIPKKAYQIWERNGFDFGKGALQNENRELKNLAEKAGLKRMINVLKHIGNRPVFESKPLHEVISTHMARRTFARAWYERGGDLNLLRDFLGHSDLSTTLNYIGIENDEASNEAFKLFG